MGSGAGETAKKLGGCYIFRVLYLCTFALISTIAKSRLRLVLMAQPDLVQAAFTGPPKSTRSGHLGWAEFRKTSNRCDADRLLDDKV